MDFSEYDFSDIFKISEAAFLLIDQHPGDPDPKVKKAAEIVARQLVTDVRQGNLKARKPESDHSEIALRLNGSESYPVEYYEPELKVTIRYPDEHKKADSSWLVTRDDLANWANAKGMRPVFLFGQETPQHDKPVEDAVSDRLNDKPVFLSTKQIDRARFQAIAKAMWEKNPKLERQKITKSDDMKFFVMTYTKETLRKWIKEVDPEPNRPAGRPRENTQSI